MREELERQKEPKSVMSTVVKRHGDFCGLSRSGLSSGTKILKPLLKYHRELGLIKVQIFCGTRYG